MNSIQKISNLQCSKFLASFKFYCAPDNLTRRTATSISNQQWRSKRIETLPKYLQLVRNITPDFSTIKQIDFAPSIAPKPSKLMTECKRLCSSVNPFLNSHGNSAKFGYKIHPKYRHRFSADGQMKRTGLNDIPNSTVKTCANGFQQIMLQPHSSKDFADSLSILECKDDKGGGCKKKENPCKVKSPCKKKKPKCKPKKKKCKPKKKKCKPKKKNPCKKKDPCKKKKKKKDPCKKPDPCKKKCGCVEGEFQGDPSNIMHIRTPTELEKIKCCPVHSNMASTSFSSEYQA